MARRVLITEPLAESGVNALRAAGFAVDVRVELDKPALLDAVAGAAALIVRSATQVDADVIDAGSDLVVVGRAGSGVDNIDVVAATRRGVMVVNAPGANSVSMAEHTMALLLAQARNIPQAHAALKAGRWERSKFAGVELHGRTLGVLGLGPTGALVAQRGHAFGMRLIAWDPWLAAERARQMGVELVPLEQLFAEADFVTVHVQKTADTIGLIGKELLARAKPGLRLVNCARGGIVDEEALAGAIAAGTIAGAALDVFATEPTTESPLFELDAVVVTPHLAASTEQAQEKAGLTIAEQVILALHGDFVPFAINVAATEASETVRPFLPLAETLGRLVGALAGGLADRLDLLYEGQIADYDCRVLTLGVLKGLFAHVVAEPVSYVNAPQLAEERGVDVRETKSSSARDYVNLITLRAGDVHVAGTLVGDKQRIVGIADHTVDVPPSRHMLVVRNADRPGMIAGVTGVLADAGVNISDMHLGKTPQGQAALQVLSLDEPASPDVVHAIRAVPGILDAKPIELE
jgi:D-3-phosphoglycerate dehydrogenase